MFLTQPLNRYIDHTLLKPAAMDVAFESLLDEAVKFNFHSVCVSPYIAIPTVTALKPYPDIKVCTVVAFPHGNLPVELKIREAAFFASKGVHEIDWVLHYGEVLNERWDNVELEARLIGDVCKAHGVVSKCIVETAVLKHPATLTRIYETIYNGSNVDFIKTSTGYSTDGAQVEHVQH